VSTESTQASLHTLLLDKAVKHWGARKTHYGYVPMNSISPWELMGHFRNQKKLSWLMI